MNAQTGNHYNHVRRTPRHFCSSLLKKRNLSYTVFLYSLLLLTGCFGPETPQEVTKAFWNSVINNNHKGVIRYSTLGNDQSYDGFTQDWSGFQPSWGRIVIDGNEATIVADFLKENGSDKNSRRVITYLIKEQHDWKVDYVRTNRHLTGGSFANLLELFDQIGEDVSNHFKSSTDTLSEDIERLSEQFMQLSNEIGEQTSRHLENYAEQLRQKLKELSDSVQRALKEQDQQLSPKDRWTMNAVIANLNNSCDQLADPGFDAIANSSQTVALASRQLASVDNGVLKNYKTKWRAWEQEFEATMQQALFDLSTLAEDRT